MNFISNSLVTLRLSVKTYFEMLWNEADKPLYKGYTLRQEPDL